MRVEGYCFACDARKTMLDERVVTEANGRLGVRGLCPDCGAEILGTMGEHDARLLQEDSAKREAPAEQQRVRSTEILGTEDDDDMLVATFNLTTGWAGKRVTLESDQYVLEGYGPIDARGLVEYDDQGQLDWVRDDLRTLVRSQALGYVLFPGDANLANYLTGELSKTAVTEFGFQEVYCLFFDEGDVRSKSRKDRKNYAKAEQMLCEQVRCVVGILRTAYDQIEAQGSTWQAFLNGFPELRLVYAQMHGLLTCPWGEHATNLEWTLEEAVFGYEVDVVVANNGQPRRPDIPTGFGH